MVKILAIADQFAKILSANLLLYYDFLLHNTQFANAFYVKHVLGINSPKVFTVQYVLTV